MIDELIARLRPVEGQVRGIQRMVADGRPLQRRAPQIAEARAALDAAGLVILEARLHDCLDRADDRADTASSSPP